MLSADSITATGSARMTAGGFLPEHPVRLLIDGRFVSTLSASGAGVVSYLIRPARLRLAPGTHTITLTSMLVTQARSFRTG